MEVARSIIQEMEPIFMHIPETEREWLEVAAEFETRTCLPNCLGSIGECF